MGLEPQEKEKDPCKGEKGVRQTAQARGRWAENLLQFSHIFAP